MSEKYGSERPTPHDATRVRSAHRCRAAATRSNRCSRPPSTRHIVATRWSVWFAFTSAKISPAPCRSSRANQTAAFSGISRSSRKPRVLPPQVPQLVALHRRQAVRAAPLVKVRLPHPVADRLRRALELSRDSSSACDPCVPTPRSAAGTPVRIASSSSGHLLTTVSGRPQSGSTAGRSSRDRPRNRPHGEHDTLDAEEGVRQDRLGTSGGPRPAGDASCRRGRRAPRGRPSASGLAGSAGVAPKGQMDSVAVPIAHVPVRGIAARHRGDAVAPHLRAGFRRAASLAALRPFGGTASIAHTATRTRHRECEVAGDPNGATNAPMKRSSGANDA